MIQQQQLKDCNFLFVDRDRSLELNDSLKSQLKYKNFLLSLKDSSIMNLNQQNENQEKIYGSTVAIKNIQLDLLQKKYKKQKLVNKLELIGIGILTTILIIK